MNQTNSLPSPTTAPIEASTILRRLSVLDPGLQRMELLCCCCCCCWGFTVFTEGIFVPVVVLENCPIISADLTVTA